VCTRINYKIVPVTNRIYTMVQVEMNNMHINIAANNGSEKLTKEKTQRLPVS